MSSSTLADSYLFLQGLIEQRLMAQLSTPEAPVPVEGVESLASAGAGDMRPMVVHVMWAGDVVAESESGRAGRGSSQMVRQRWMVSLYLRNAAQVNRDARNGEAGKWLYRIHRALAGWQPDGLARAFVRAGSPAPSYTKNSGMYPLGFEITLTL